MTKRDPFMIAAGKLDILDPAKIVQLPGYLTVYQAAHFLIDQLVGAAKDGSAPSFLKPFVPGAVRRKDGEPVEWSRRVFFRGERGFRSRRIVMEIPAARAKKLDTVARMNSVFSSMIFRPLLANELRYRLFPVGRRTALANRPEIRATIGAQIRRNANAYETSFVWKGDVLCVLLIEEESLREQAMVRSYVDRWTRMQRGRLNKQTKALFEAFAEKLRSVAAPGLLFSRPELHKACEKIAKVKKLRLTHQMYRQHLWGGSIFSGLKLTKTSGKQDDFRPTRAEKALTEALRAFLVASDTPAKNVQ